MEELNQALAALIEQATTGIDASVGFLQAEIPDVVAQLLMWHGVKSAVFAGLGAAILVVYVVAELKAFKWARGWATDESDWLIGYGMLGTAVRLPTIVFGIALLNLTWLQIWIAPKVWLIEYAAKLL